jgi:hypothetical protein
MDDFSALREALEVEQLRDRFFKLCAVDDAVLHELEALVDGAFLWTIQSELGINRMKRHFALQWGRHVLAAEICDKETCIERHRKLLRTFKGLD